MTVEVDGCTGNEQTTKRGFDRVANTDDQERTKAWVVDVSFKVAACAGRLFE